MNMTTDEQRERDTASTLLLNAQADAMQAVLRDNVNMRLALLKIANVVRSRNGVNGVECDYYMQDIARKALLGDYPQ